MSKQQTAVDWMRQIIENASIHWVSELYYNQKNEIFNYTVIRIQTEKLEEFLLKAKQMEKEQIIDAFHSKKIINTISAEQYYQETYGGNHE
jgi:hypothetical protein